MRPPDISFIVSAFNRPNSLLTCLASLADQTSDWNEIIVTDNSVDEGIQRRHKDACELFGADYIHAGAIGCYHSAEIGAQSARGEWLSFPSDDSYFVPRYAEFMLKVAREQSLDLVYAEQLYNGRWESEPYHLMGVKPQLNSIDKTGFLLKRNKFYGFPDKGEGGYCAADGMLIDRLVAEGIRHGYAPGILSVHN